MPLMHTIPRLFLHKPPNLTHLPLQLPPQQHKHSFLLPKRLIIHTKGIKTLLLCIKIVSKGIKVLPKRIKVFSAHLKGLPKRILIVPKRIKIYLFLYLWVANSILGRANLLLGVVNWQIGVVCRLLGVANSILRLVYL